MGSFKYVHTDLVTNKPLFQPKNISVRIRECFSTFFDRHASSLILYRASGDGFESGVINDSDDGRERGWVYRVC